MVDIFVNGYHAGICLGFGDWVFGVLKTLWKTMKWWKNADVLGVENFLVFWCWDWGVEMGDF